MLRRSGASPFPMLIMMQAPIGTAITNGPELPLEQNTFYGGSNSPSRTVALVSRKMTTSGRKGGKRTFAASANRSCRYVESRHPREFETPVFSAVSQGGSEPHSTPHTGQVMLHCIIHLYCEGENIIVEDNETSRFRRPDGGPEFRSGRNAKRRVRNASLQGVAHDPRSQVPSDGACPA